MRKEVIAINGRVASEIFFYLDRPIVSKNKFAELIAKEIPYSTEIGYAGYKSKLSLKRFLIWSVFGHKQASEWKCPKENNIKETIEEALNLCKSVLGEKSVKIFIFPTVNDFVIKNMHGVAGFSPWKNTILISIYSSSGWKGALKHTVGHELAHALAFNFNNRITIQDDLVFEGMAEHFCEYFIGGKKAKWVKSISRKKAKQILQKIKEKLPCQNEKLYRELFFSTGRYPLWSGYAIGYYIVGLYLKKLEKKDWKEILKIPPHEIITNSNFYSSSKT